MQKCLKPEEIINFQTRFTQFGDHLAERSLIMKRNEEEQNPDLGGIGNPFRRRMSTGQNRNRERQDDHERIRLELLTLNYEMDLIDLALENGRFSDTA